ncbi:MAG: sugar phosphate isomerase/epimerase [Planctomycetes bacterium]|nr:sugar phosphate isomerase/epimerase [Planctomycetota bacterium]
MNMPDMPEGTLGAQLYTCREYTKTIEGVAKIAEDTGMTIAATHVGWPLFQEKLDAVIEQHKLWKCEHPAIGGLPKEYHCVDGVKRFLDELPPIAEKLAAEGMDFSYHNHSKELVRYGEKTWLAQLYEQADPNMLKAEIDTYWIQHGGGDPAAWVRKCAGREPLLHLKDMLMTAEGEQRMAEIGEGNLNWPAILAEADAGGVQWYLVEQDRCYDRTPFESLEISYRNLKAMGLS